MTDCSIALILTEHTLIKLPNGKLTVVPKSMAQKLQGKVQPVTLTINKSGGTTITAATQQPGTTGNSQLHLLVVAKQYLLTIVTKLADTFRHYELLNMN